MLGKVVGLDMSLTGTGVAVLKFLEPWEGHDQIELSTIKSVGHRGDDLLQRRTRLHRITNTVMRSAEGADLVCIEGPSIGGQAAQSGKHDRSGSWWLTIDALLEQGITVVEVPPASLKTFACGKGNAGKADVAAGITRLWPDVYPKGDDQFDALCLASMAAILADLGVPFKQLAHHTKALVKVRENMSAEPPPALMEG